MRAGTRVGRAEPVLSNWDGGDVVANEELGPTAQQGVMPDVKDEPMLLTISEAARRLSLGRATAYQLALRGELPVVRIGRAVRVPARALEQWVARRISGGDDGKFDDLPAVRRRVLGR